MPKHTLYLSRGSAPCRAVLYHLSRISTKSVVTEGLFLIGDVAKPTAEIQIVDVDLNGGAHVEVLQGINPLHCLPTLETPFGPLWESRAVMLYLAELAQTENPDAWTFYPRKLYQRATVNRLLDWDQGTMYRAIGEAVYPLVFQGEEPSDMKLAALAKVVTHLDENELSDGRPYLTGHDMTVADISIAMGLSMLRLAGLEVDDVPHCESWLARMNQSPGWAEVNAFAFDAWVERAKAARAAADEPDSDEPPTTEPAKSDPTATPTEPPAKEPEPDAPESPAPAAAG